MCSCMPAFKPFFARVVPKLSIHSLTRNATRSRHHTNSEDPDNVLLEMGRYRSIEMKDNANRECSSPGDLQSMEARGT